MPEEVRKAYKEALASLSEDKNQNGIPDVLEGTGNVLGVQQSSLTINGRDVGDLPREVKQLLAYMAGLPDGKPEAPALTPQQTALMKTLDATSSFLRTVLLMLSAAAGVAAIAVGVWVHIHMDAGSRSQGGTFYVDIVILIAVAWLVGTLAAIVRQGRA
jgi:hypothetical protein